MGGKGRGEASPAGVKGDYSPALSAEGRGRNQPVIPSEARSEGTSWLLCVSILAREPPNWGGSATGRSQDARQEKGKGPMPPGTVSGA